MIHTNETLAKLSETEITDIVMKLEGATYFVNYCEDPSAIIPIATELKINSTYNYSNGCWYAGGYNSKPLKRYFETYSDNRLRAFCECIILMNQGDV